VHRTKCCIFYFAPLCTHLPPQAELLPIIISTANPECSIPTYLLANRLPDLRLHLSITEDSSLTMDAVLTVSAKPYSYIKPGLRFSIVWTVMHNVPD
jgi:hypothetical protein